jgi:hypothetical protein
MSTTNAMINSTAARKERERTEIVTHVSFGPSVPRSDPGDRATQPYPIPPKPLDRGEVSKPPGQVLGEYGGLFQIITPPSLAEDAGAGASQRSTAR